MKKQTVNKPEFTRQSLVELNEQKMTAIVGGTITPSGTFVITLTLQTITERVDS